MSHKPITIEDAKAEKWIRNVIQYLNDTEYDALPESIETNRDDLKNAFAKYAEAIMQDVPIDDKTQQKELFIGKDIHLSWNRHGVICAQYTGSSYNVYRFLGSAIDYDVNKPNNDEERIAKLTAQNVELNTQSLAAKIIDCANKFAPHNINVIAEYVKHTFTPGNKPHMPYKIEPLIKKLHSFIDQMNELDSRYDRVNDFFNDFECALTNSAIIVPHAKKAIDRMQDMLDESSKYPDDSSDPLTIRDIINDLTVNGARSHYYYKMPSILSYKSDIRYTDIMRFATMYPEFIKIRKNPQYDFDCYDVTLPIYEMYETFCKLKNKYLATLHAYAYIDNNSEIFKGSWYYGWERFERTNFDKDIDTDKKERNYISDNIFMMTALPDADAIAQIREKMNQKSHNTTLETKIILETFAQKVMPLSIAYKAAESDNKTIMGALNEYAQFIYEINNPVEDRAINTIMNTMAIAAMNDIVEGHDPDINKLKTIAKQYTSQIRTRSMPDPKNGSIPKSYITIPGDTEYETIKTRIIDNAKMYIENLKTLQKALLTSNNTELLKWFYEQKTFSKQAYVARIKEIEAHNESV